MEQQIFTKNKELNDFKQWALQLGCPISALPSGLALNRVMKSGYKDSLFKVMNMVRPRNEIKINRDNLLLDAVSTSSTMQAKSSNQRLQNDKNIKRIKTSINDVLSQVEEYKAAAISKQAVICDKGMQIKVLKKDCYDNRVKCIRLEEKRSELKEKLKKEKEFEAFIEKSTPVDSTKSNIDISHANSAIEKSVALLKSVYDAIGDRPLTKPSKVKLEKELEKIIANIPPFILLEAIKYQNNHQMQLIEKKFNDDLEPFKTNNSEMSGFQIFITKIKVKLFRMNLQTIQLKEEEKMRVDDYVTCYEQFLDSILQQMIVFNLDDSELDPESICGEYLKEFITWNSNKGLSDYYEKTINDWQIIVSEREDQLKVGEIVISALSNLYSEIEKYYNDIMDDIAALGVVNKKLKYLQELSTYTINSTRNWNIANSSMSVYNHSKFQFDCSTFNMKSTPAEYSNEVLMLAGVPTNKWNINVPVNIAMEIAGQLPEMIISPLFSFLTPNAALKESKLNCAWHRVINNFAATVATDIVVPEFSNYQVVSTNVISEAEKMSDLMKTIKLSGERNNKLLIAAQKYLNFLLNTSLGTLIPPNVLINRRNFQDYETELLCVFSMIKKL